MLVDARTTDGAPPLEQPVLGPPPPPWWLQPTEVTFGFAAAIVGLGCWVAATFWARPGLQWAVAAVAGLLIVASARRFRQPGARPAQHRWQAVFAALAVALLGTVAIRDSGPMTAVVTVAALGLAAFAVADDPRPRAVLMAPLLAVVAWGRAFAWWPVVPRTALPRAQTAVLRGIGIAVVLSVAVGWLLASADVAFLGLIRRLVPTWDLELLVARAIIAGVVISLVAALAFAVAAPPPLGARKVRRAGAIAEWLIPSVALIVVLTVFFGVQAAVLFDAYPADLLHGDLTPAERARQGFGQLVCVSLIIVGTLTWAASRAASRAASSSRAVLALTGGVLVVQLELLVASAVRRMYLYENTFGWTVLRVEVAWFEVWLGVMTLVLAVLWLVGQGRHGVRVAVASAGLGVLVLALIGPDLIVARASVARFAETGKIDTWYLSRLDADAVPALTTLPEPERDCVLADAEPGGDPLYAFNVSRWRADRILQAAPAFTTSSSTCADPYRTFD